MNLKVTLSVSLSRLKHYICFNEIWHRDYLIPKEGHSLLSISKTNIQTGRAVEKITYMCSLFVRFLTLPTFVHKVTLLLLIIDT